MEPADPDSSPSGRNYLLRLLSRREYSRHELRQKLAQKGVRANEAEALLDRFVAIGYIDDRRFAEAYVRQQQSKGKGDRLIRQQLKAKGIAPELADEALAPVDDIETVRHLVTTRYATVDLTDFKQRRRLFAALMRRGFNPSLIHEVLGTFP